MTFNDSALYEIDKVTIQIWSEYVHSTYRK